MHTRRPLAPTSVVLALSVLAAPLLASCEKEPVTFSGPVGISLDAQASDVTAGVISVNKNINTESGNPCQAYVRAATDVLGTPPGGIEVLSVTLALLGTSSGVTALEQVFTGTVTVWFEPNSSKRLIQVASVSGPTGAGPVPMPLMPNAEPVTQAEFEDIRNCSYKVILGGPAASGFEASGGTARMTATFEFVAWD